MSNEQWTPVLMPDETFTAIGYCWRWAQLYAEKVDNEESYRFMCSEIDKVVLWEEAMKRRRTEQPAPQGAMPSWDDAPEWAMWWAADAVGWAQWYMVEPYCDDGEGACWCPQSIEGDLSKGIDSPEVDRRVIVPIGVDWRTLKRQRPTSPAQE